MIINPKSSLTFLWLLVPIALVSTPTGCKGRHNPSQDLIEGPISTEFNSGSAIDPNAVTYPQVKSIFQTRCASCHPKISPPNWLTYKEAYIYAKNGLLVKRVWRERSMPQSGSRESQEITDKERNLLKEWAEAGGLEDINSAPLAIGSQDLKKDSNPAASEEGFNPTEQTVEEIQVGGNPEARIFYDKEVLPLLQEKCFSCHNGNPLPNWTEYNLAVSKLTAINHRILIKKDMPLGGKLTEPELAIMAEWINLERTNNPTAAQEDGDLATISLDTNPLNDTPAASLLNPKEVQSVATGGQSELFYDSIILPIVKNKCTSCHGENSYYGNWTSFSVLAAKIDALENRILIKGDMPALGELSALEKIHFRTFIQEIRVELENGNAQNPLDIATCQPVESCATIVDSDIVDLPTSSDPTNDPTDTTEADKNADKPSWNTYQASILPLVKEKCAACHGSGSNYGNWTSYDTMTGKIAAVENRILIKGDMPAVGSLDADQKLLIQNWIPEVLQDLANAGGGENENENTPPPEPDDYTICNILPPMSCRVYSWTRVVGKVLMGPGKTASLPSKHPTGGVK